MKLADLFPDTPSLLRRHHAPLEVVIAWNMLKDVDVELVTVDRGDAIVRLRGAVVPIIIRALNDAKGRARDDEDDAPGP